MPGHDIEAVISTAHPARYTTSSLALDELCTRTALRMIGETSPIATNEILTMLLESDIDALGLPAAERRIPIDVGRSSASAFAA